MQKTLLATSLASVALISGLHAPRTTRATDFALQQQDTYYERALAGAPLAAFESRSAGLPERLFIDHDDNVQATLSARKGGSGLLWQLAIDKFVRKHERIDALYQQVLVLPFPVDENGEDAFELLDWKLRPQTGPEPDAPALVYGGEAVTYSRNIVLERQWLPLLLGTEPGRLPSLDGTGLGWRLFDTIVSYDPEHGPIIEGSLRVRFKTAPGVALPDPDEELAVYLVTLIPTLDHDAVPPATVRGRLELELPAE